MFGLAFTFTVTASGTPAAGNHGRYPASITASNARGSVTKSVTIVIAQQG